MKSKVMLIAGARPNFMKVAPIVKALEREPGIETILVHTGQHYDLELSDVFFRDLQLRQPDIYLSVGSGSHAVQTARVMERFEPVLLEKRPDILVVVGDVNSTVACALVAAKIQYPADAGSRRPLIAHVEAGLRSGDWSMPEEVNRVVTDRISDLLFTPSADADENLAREGLDPSRVHRVGNVMIDTLLRLLPKAEERWQAGKLQVDDLEFEQRKYVLVTLHRPSNVDDQTVLTGIMRAIEKISRRLPVIFPMHPRTRSRLATLNLPFDACGSAVPLSAAPVFDPLPFDLCSLHLTSPLGYLDFLALMSQAKLVLTDSGGIQEETTALGVPCLTLRENTERPVTVTEGTNTLVGTEPERIIREAFKVLDSGASRGRIPALWDGATAKRIADILAVATA